MAFAALAAPIAGALLGGLAGGGGGSQSQTTTRDLAPESAIGKRGGEVSLQNLNELQSLLAAGPGQQDVQAGTQSSRDLASLLQSFAQGGFLPGQADIATSQGLAQQLFAGQQNALQNAFSDQRVQASRNAARMGRSAIDPVLQNKLAQEQTRQQGQLNADIGSYATNFALQLPQQRLGFQQQLAQVQSGLASQAMANRQALLSLGSQLQQQDQNFRLGSASTTTTQSQSGGLQGAITGALSGASAGLGAGKALGGFNFGSLFGGGGTNASAGSAAQTAWYRG